MAESTPHRPYRGVSADERFEERRRRVLAAGRECFVENGDALPDLARVCARAGVSKRHFYELYHDRLDLLDGLHVEAMAWIREGFPLDTHPSDPVGWIAWLVPELFARLLEDPVRAHVLALAPVQAPRASPSLADLIVAGLARRVRRVDGRPAASRERVRRHALAAVFAGRALVAEWLLAVDGPARGRAMTGYIEDVVSASTGALSSVLP